MTDLFNALLIEPPGRAAGSSLLVVAGAALFAYGARTWLRALRISAWDMERNVVWVRGFRAGIVGLAIIALGAAWLTQQLWVLLIALAIGGEELLETSALLFAFRRNERLKRSFEAERS
jgi:hypothetical protein